MKRELSGIADYIGKEITLRIDRKPLDKHLLDGFVVGLSEKLLLLHVVDGNMLLLNGYAAVRLSDVRSYHVDDTFISPALRLLDRRPVLPEEIDLTDWAGLLASIQRRYPLITIEIEKQRPGCCFIGRVVKAKARKVALETVSMEGKWDTTEKFAFRHITQMAFDNGYVNALAHFVAHEAQMRTQ